MKQLNNKSGFTLIELIIYIALVSMVVSAMILFSWDIIYSRIKSNAQVSVEANLHYATDRISTEIRNASGITTLTPTSITLSNSDSVRNPTIIDLNGGRIRLGFGSSPTCPSTSPCPITDNGVTVSGLTFTNLSSGPTSSNVRITFTVGTTSNRSEGTYSSSTQTAVEIRTD